MVKHARKEEMNYDCFKNRQNLRTLEHAQEYIGCNISNPITRTGLDFKSKAGEANTRTESKCEDLKSSPASPNWRI